jgi:hypothetical protein
VGSNPTLSAKREEAVLHEQDGSFLWLNQEGLPHETIEKDSALGDPFLRCFPGQLNVSDLIRSRLDDGSFSSGSFRLKRVTIGFLGIFCLFPTMTDDIDPIGLAFVTFAPVSAIVDFAQYISRHALSPLCSDVMFIFHDPAANMTVNSGSIAESRVSGRTQIPFST